jgi:hypothetical protein
MKKCLKDNLKTMKAMVSVMNPKQVKNPIFNGVPLARKKYAKRKKSSKPRNNEEARVLKSIAQWLGLMPTVIWFERLNSGKVMSAFSGRWMQLCKKGTPDYIALINDGEFIHVLFIEGKSNIGVQSAEQKEFENGMLGFINVHYIVARSASDVTKKINNITVKDLNNDQSI